MGSRVFLALAKMCCQELGTFKQELEILTRFCTSTQEHSGSLGVERTQQVAAAHVHSGQGVRACRGWRGPPISFYPRPAVNAKAATSPTPHCGFWKEQVRESLCPAINSAKGVLNAHPPTPHPPGRLSCEGG